MKTVLTCPPIVLVLLLAGAAADEPKPEALPPGAKLVAIEAEPASVVLKHRYDYVQLLLTGRLESGEPVDVTRMAELQGAADVVAVSSGRLIRAKADGRGELNFTLGGQSVQVPLEVSGVGEPYHVNFSGDVMPIMSKLGCNSGTCHGSNEGRNGFKLSLRGYDPLFDHRALTDDLGARRINRASPENSLMLLKATGAVPHVGGAVTTTDHPYFDIIRAWIADGLKLDLETPRVTHIELAPHNPVAQREGMKQQMRVLATYEDGTVRDVTAEAFIETGNQDVATADATGLMTVLRRGEAAILARFEGAYAATTITVMGDRSGFEWQPPPVNNPIDELVYEKLERVKTLPSDLCSDDEFLRRVYIDLTGLPPRADEVRAFLADPRDTKTKRDEVIDQLVGSAEYIEHWSNRWADLLQVNGKFLGREGAAAFRNWIKQAVAENMPYDEFVHAILTASGSNRDNPPASYFKILRDPVDAMENTTHLFLAVRFNCNKCHDHPFERWTQDQYYQMAAYFSQVGLKNDPASGDRKIGGTAVEGAKPLYEVVFDRGSGEVTHDRTGQVTPPAFPYEHEFDRDEGLSRRHEMARWLTSRDNRYFARSYANRLWGYLLGVGLIEPIDDIRAGNPPTNPELLDWLTDQFIESGFDARHLVREICKSRTYQHSVVTNRWNEDDQINYSHALARRLPAEVLYDAVHKVTGSVSRLPGMPAGSRAAQLPDSGIELPSGFLDQFGRPARESSCECERSSGLMLGPIMALVNGPTIAEAIADPNNAITRLVADEKDDRALVNELFLRILNRPAAETEVEAGIAALTAMEGEHQQLVAELEQYEAALPARLEEWEKQQQEAQWSVLKIVEATAANGATIEVEDDPELIARGENGSLFVSGSNGRGQYKVVAHTDLAGITAIRLELLPDERLPSKGPGRAGNGNYVLSSLTLQAAPQDQPDQAAAVKLQSAQADFSQDNFEVAKAIDGSTGTGWASSPRFGEKRVAIFETAGDISHPGGTALTLVLDQQHDDQHTIGRFRILATTSPRPVQLQGPPPDVASILAVAAGERSDEQKAALLQYYRGLDRRLQELQQAVAASAAQLGNQRLIGAQDLAWALINSPAFLFNR